jgi:hypothetical protein
VYDRNQVESARKADRLAQVNMYKTEAGCKVCGERRAWCLDFHHRDPDTKSFQLQHREMLRRWDVIVEEMLKCDVLCANCHRDHHYQEKLDVRSNSQDRGSDA